MAAAAAAASGSNRAFALPMLNNQPEGSPLKWQKAPCRFCGTGCHVMVGTENGRVVAIQGDQKAEVNKGLLCVKGYHVGLALYGKDRLTTPMLRKNGKLVPISWDEAIDIAQAHHGEPQGLRLLRLGPVDHRRGLRRQQVHEGRPRQQPHRRQPAPLHGLRRHGLPLHVRRRRAAGRLRRHRRRDVAIMWGNNMAEMHPVLFSRLVDRRARGEKVTIIDMTTRRTRTSDLADTCSSSSPTATSPSPTASPT
jgi:nitrate reductase NapA